MPIVKKVGNVSYKVHLLGWLNAHPTFHIRCSMPYHDDLVDNSSNSPVGDDPKVTKEVRVLKHNSPTEWWNKGKSRFRSF